MQITNVHIFEIDVVFTKDPAPKVKLEGDVTITKDGAVIGNPPGIPQGIHLLRFKLRSEDVTLFPSNPIEWLAADGGYEMPPEWILHWQSPKQFGMVIFNALAGRKAYDFNVVVSYQGELYSTDPTVICDPPGLE